MTIGAIGVRHRDSVICSAVHLINVGQVPGSREHCGHWALGNKRGRVNRLLPQVQSLHEVLRGELLPGVQPGLHVREDLVESGQSRVLPALLGYFDCVEAAGHARATREGVRRHNDGAS